MVAETTPNLEAMLKGFFKDNDLVDKLVSRLRGRMQRILENHELQNIFA